MRPTVGGARLLNMPECWTSLALNIYTEIQHEKDRQTLRGEIRHSSRREWYDSFRTVAMLLENSITGYHVIKSC